MGILAKSSRQEKATFQEIIYKSSQLQDRSPSGHIHIHPLQKWWQMPRAELLRRSASSSRGQMSGETGLLNLHQHYLLVVREMRGGGGTGSRVLPFSILFYPALINKLMVQDQDELNFA